MMLPVLLLTFVCVGLCSIGIYVNHRRAYDRKRARLLDLAGEIFGDEAKLARWFNKPLSRFEGKSPAEMMESRDGLKKVEQLLIEIQEGYF